MERDDDEPEQVCKRARIADVAEDLNVCEEAAQLLHLVEQSKSTGPKVAPGMPDLQFSITSLHPKPNEGVMGNMSSNSRYIG